MGKAARKAWELWFAPQVLFMRIGGWLEELVRANPGGGRIRPVYVMFQVTKNKVVDKTKSYIKRLIGRN
ncbi:MAG: hypothetical protein NZZ41_07450 [Candidatus Dojkabacteria bacterium]|nr:hypothetical protein [Candidatus Dojkabacteria bacterium]